MNIPSFHQNDLFNELTKSYDEFRVVFAHTKDKERVNQGWNSEQAQHYESNTIGRDLNFWQVVSYVFKNRRATHIVNGIWAEKSLFFVIILLNIFKANFLIYSEAPISTKDRSFSKKIILRFIVIPLAKLLIIRAKGILAVSVFAVEYFESLGVKAEKICRFGYFRTVVINDENSPENLPHKLKYREFEQIKHRNPTKSRDLSLIFVGQLIERKGIMTLIKALKIISEKNNSFHLTIIGTGELKSVLKAFINLNQLQNRVTLLGVVSSENIIDYIEKADLLILPSISDGWGMVINEALQSHVPVLVSDQCGAKELVRVDQNGFIFQGNNIESLVENLQRFLNLSPEKKMEMKHYAGEMGKKISVLEVSHYLNRCVEHCLEPQSVKPTAPWLND